jgi:Fic family protein
MQVVSGPIGKARVHYEAPAAVRLSREMSAFLDWFNRPPEMDEVLKSGIAHLWFVTIHPFDDGNGRIARAIADMLLARSEKSPQRFYSMSEQIRQERKAYYDILEQTQKNTMDVTQWLIWFLSCLGRAIENAQTYWQMSSPKRVFGNVFRSSIERTSGPHPEPVTRRLRRKVTTSKYAKLAKCSQDTALRDILSLVEQGILVRSPAGGRSTSYALPETVNP